MSTIASSAPRRALRSLVPPLKHLVLLAVGLMMVAPFIWMVLTSFKPLSQLLTDPLSALPDPWIFTNWPDAWNALPFGRAYLNSFYITVLVVAGTLLTTSMAAYGFSRLPFKGSKVIFGIFLAMQMVPKQVTLVPFYFLMAKIGWVDSHLALIVPAILVNPFGVFLMRQFIASIPRELEEAAMIDGASRWRIYWKVILPAIRPGMGALGIIVALDAWNNFLLPLVLLNSTELFTVPLLLSQFNGQFGGMNYGIVMAATSLSTIPMLIAFLIGQRQIIESLATSGLGGR
ncbi:MAG: carbohydrate ABC transporter permease [Actinomyces urogenitalis]|jgi:multiple sugar transport system permease protein|uniref:ABC transporter, permease protein n=4 Tax=Actinomyces urogenitalis TaxID=103621 RepID=C0W6J6_9ACTO|nr:carbohydrate ABC transporter permease [Actinomyces urogenitalis]EEH65520.1 ABC transporter, permease protein [Actinomyces urogenitalis DSM 15434]MBS5977140.1 carbohydrate ABC transporter permease [Actinomyces urogenitalis]MDK8237850.1 carbohydrate ABC transporter permease [Actinomyces urogenitalis]MDU0973165.1 carbohydrate ABC transporter permease [Actinomyces urogenitalis]MDU5427892.1 carbohydrate ABC transporter permease [Actinomyces urogenitalis]